MDFFLVCLFLITSSDVIFSNTLNGNTWSRPNEGIATIENQINEIENEKNRRVRALWNEQDIDDPNCRTTLINALMNEEVHITLTVLDIRKYTNVVQALEAQNAIALEDILSDARLEQKCMLSSILQRCMITAWNQPQLIHMLLRSHHYNQDPLLMFPLACLIGDIGTVQNAIDELLLVKLPIRHFRYITRGFLLSIIFKQWKISEFVLNRCEGCCYLDSDFENFVFSLLHIKAVGDKEYARFLASMINEQKRFFPPVANVNLEEQFEETPFDSSIIGKGDSRVVKFVKFAIACGAPSIFLQKLIIHIVHGVDNAILEDSMKDFEQCGYIDRTARLVTIGDSYISYRK